MISIFSSTPVLVSCAKINLGCDINNIDINKPLAEKYYAAAFIKVDGKTYWSDPISCTLNTTKKLEGYTPQGGNE